MPSDRAMAAAREIVLCWSEAFRSRGLKPLSDDEQAEMRKAIASIIDKHDKGPVEAPDRGQGVGAQRTAAIDASKRGEPPAPSSSELARTLKQLSMMPGVRDEHKTSLALNDAAVRITELEAEADQRQVALADALNPDGGGPTVQEAWDVDVLHEIRDLFAERDAFKADRNRLAAIVEKLPRTEDGVRFVPDADVTYWCICRDLESNDERDWLVLPCRVPRDCDEWTHAAAEWNHSLGHPGWQIDGAEGDCEVAGVYSTPEAARAAKGDG